MNKNRIYHPRLYAFFQSKVINGMMLVVIIGLMMMWSGAWAVVCASVGLVCAIGYSLWLWIKKPQKVVVNAWLSTVNSIYCLYYLIAVAIGYDKDWVWIVPAVGGVVVLFVAMITSHDEVFDIKSKV